MDIRQIRYFVTVAREKNFTRAAKVLHISQPPLSRQIQLLEEDLGVILLHRNSRPIRLTEAGKVFYEQALQLLSRFDQIKRTTQLIGKNQRKVLSIGFVPSTLYGALPTMVKRLKQLRPDTDIQLVEILSIQQAEALRTGRIDVGFGRIRANAPGVSRLVLREERLMLAIPQDHPLAGPEDSPVAMSQLKEQRLLLYPKANRPNFTDQVLTLLNDHGIYPSDTQEVSELQTALGLVAADSGLCIVPSSVRSLRRDLCYRLLGDKHMMSPVILSYRTNDSLDVVEQILELLEKMYHSGPSWAEHSINRLVKKDNSFL